MRQNLRDATNRTVDVRYNMLVRRVIENESHDKRWSRSKVLNAYVTIANIDPAIIDAGDIVVKAFDIERENRSEWKCLLGDTWGAGLVLFVTGVPLDNIRSVTDPSAGYYRYYKEIEQKSAIFLHHSYMLDQGKYIKRKTIFNIEKKADRDLLLQDGKDIEKLFSDNYEEKKLIDIFKSAPDDVVQDPPSEQNKENPTSDLDKQNPQGGLNKQNPQGGLNKQDPQGGLNKQDPQGGLRKRARINRRSIYEINDIDTNNNLR